MKKNVFILIIVNFTFYCFGQQKVLNPCGTIAEKTEWLQHYQLSPEEYRTAGDTLLYVPLSIHILGTDNGTGYYRVKQLLRALCQLNADFVPSNIQFFIEGDIHYVNNTDWYDHESFEGGAEMMSENYISSTLNCFIVTNPAGNCGYSWSTYGGIALAKGCIGSGDHTWAHEVGHFLSLPHPFYGWEGQDHDNTVPAPNLVNYTEVEKIDRSNCSFAADGFCDTPPDYLSYRWNCNSENESNVTQLDPDGIPFVSDGSLFMSYSADACASRFSDDQMAAMRANLCDENQDFLYGQTPPEPISNQLAFIMPIEDEIVQFDDVLLEWESVANATQYIVEVTRILNYAQFEYIVDGTSIWLDHLQNDKKYYWRIRPFNNYEFCTELSDYASFMTENIMTTSKIIELSEWEIFPTILTNQSNIVVKIEHATESNYHFTLLDLNGKILLDKELNTRYNEGAQFKIRLPDALNNGMYIAALNSENGRVIKKIILAK